TAEIPLVEGSNTIKFTVTSKKNNGAGSNALFYLDYIQLERKDSAEYKNSKFEGEDATGSGRVISGTDGDGFSGGAWRQNYGTATTTFDTAAGEYELYLTLGASIDTTQRPNGKYLGRAAISIDGGADIALDGTNMTIVKGLTGLSAQCTNSAMWKYNPVLTLTEGEHTLAVKYAGIGENGNNNEYIIYDCFELVPQDAEIDGANISIVSSKIACGNTAQANAFLYYTNKHICPDSVIKSTVYSSSNTAIASVDENGLITALNPGIANISVTFTDNEDQTYTASKQVFVYDESGIILVSSNYDETTHKATIKLTRVTDGTDTAVVVIGAFGKVGDKLTSFTSSPEIINSVNPEKGGVIKIEKTIEGDAIRGFVWNNLTEMKPATDSVVLK
nr:Ig-like domain-containing protein [Bacillota bacterium]